MDKALINVLAEVIAARDGYAAHEVLGSYYTEAREIVIDLNGRGVDLVRTKDDG